MMLLITALSFVLSFALGSTFNQSLDNPWTTYKEIYNKNYGDRYEFIRRSIWEANLKHIGKHNLETKMGHHGYTIGINEYSDMTRDEFKAKKSIIEMSQTLLHGSHFLHAYNSEPPSSIDWREHGFVTPVKNEGQSLCGSWAFSATGAVEGQHFRKTARLVSLSEQQLCDCMNGAWHDMDSAFEYIKEVGGIDSEATYPAGPAGQCQFNPAGIGAKVTGYTDISRGNETDLMLAVGSVGPVAVAVDASHFSFQLYRTGIYSDPDCSSSSVDLAMLVVGYGSEQGQDYWILKNSWGVAWGEDGYMKMARNKNNMCGIATMASYPLV